MMKSSIHTLQLQTQISPDECKALKSVFHKLQLSVENKSSVDKKSVKYRNNIIVYRRFPYHGINNITILQNIRILKHNMAIIKYYLYATINPYNALHGCQNSGADIIEPEKIEDSMKIVMYYLNSLLSTEIASRLSLYRLDFCMDLVFPTQTQADEYIKLLKKGITPEALSEKYTFNPRQHKLTPYNDAMLLECQSYSFEIYPKYRQMVERKMKVPEAAKGIVRLELRASKSKIRQLFQKYNIPWYNHNSIYSLKYAPDITEQEICKMMAKMVGKGCFYTYGELIAKIESADYKSTDIELMIQIVKYFSRHQLCQDMLNDLNLTRQKWNKILKKFNKVQCSPIPIPRSCIHKIYPGVSVWKESF